MWNSNSVPILNTSKCIWIFLVDFVKKFDFDPEPESDPELPATSDPERRERLKGFDEKKIEVLTLLVPRTYLIISDLKYWLECISDGKYTRLADPCHFLLIRM